MFNQGEKHKMSHTDIKPLTQAKTQRQDETIFLFFFFDEAEDAGPMEPRLRKLLTIWWI